MVAIAKDWQATRLDKDEGHDVLFVHEHVPVFFIADRDFVITFYEKYDKETGFYNYFESSKGNEEITKKQKERIGNDVVAKIKLNFIQFKPYEGGMEINSIMILDIGGNLPSFLSKAVAKKASIASYEMATKVMNDELVPSKVEDGRENSK